MALDPIILIMCGFICGIFGYAAAAAFVDRAFKLAPSVVDREMEKFAKMTAERVSDHAAIVAVQLAGKVEHDAVALAQKVVDNGDK